MNQREDDSRIKRKVIALGTAEHFRQKLRGANSWNRPPPRQGTRPAGGDIDLSIAGHTDVTARTAASFTACLDEQICAFEAAAREKYLAAIQAARLKMPTGWFRQYYENRILPAFCRIGFDDGLTRALFSMAAFSWQWMGPVARTRHWCHPDLIRRFEEIRNGILPTALGQRHFPMKTDLHTGLPPDPLMTADIPPNKQPMVKSISWIILPRAYRHLGRHDCRYLPAYLRFIERENNAECARIFIKSMIQFTANYALKFAAEFYPPSLLAAIVVSGYEAMFWKNLRSPPVGFQDAAVFESFLSWTKMFWMRNSAANSSRKHPACKMEATKAEIFPSKASRVGVQPGCAGDGRYLVALRHGLRGIRSLLDCFGRSPALLETATGTTIYYQPDLRVLNDFLQSIKAGYQKEDSQTRQTIRRCLACLIVIFQQQQNRLNPHRDGCRLLLGFVRSRAVAMIQTLRDDLQL